MCLLDAGKSVFSWSAETRCLCRVSDVMDPLMAVDADVPAVVLDAQMNDPSVPVLPRPITHLLRVPGTLAGSFRDFFFIFFFLSDHERNLGASRYIRFGDLARSKYQESSGAGNFE